MQDNHCFPGDPLMVAPALFGPLSLLAFADSLPNIPAMISTHLQLELLLQESSVDLRAVSEVILSDAGATLQILRLIGEEYPDHGSRPTRIEDCIVSLNVELWYDAICASGMSNNGPLILEWQHCRRIAECARAVARCVEGFSPEEAYIVGLLNRLGHFPHLLGWDQTGNTPGEHRALGVMLAGYWNLPRYLTAAIQEQQDHGRSGPWTQILQVAHQLEEQGRSQSVAEQRSR